MTELKVELSDAAAAFAPGEEVRGRVSWNIDEPSPAVELRLFWFTRGKGTEDAGIVQTVKFDQALPRETRSFELRLPEAPYSFSGQLISLVWALELVAYPSKRATRCEIEMGPGRKEVRLDHVENPAPAQRWLSVQTS
jgi:hypothetical protein